MTMTMYSKLKEGKSTCSRQRKECKDVLKRSLTHCNISTESQADVTLNMDGWRSTISEGTRTFSAPEKGSSRCDQSKLKTTSIKLFHCRVERRFSNLLHLYLSYISAIVNMHQGLASSTTYLSIYPIVLVTVAAPHDLATNFRHSSRSSALLTASLSSKSVQSQMLSSIVFSVCLSFSLPVQCPGGLSWQVPKLL